MRRRWPFVALSLVLALLFGPAVASAGFVPEPGHASAALASHPAHASATSIPGSETRVAASALSQRLASALLAPEPASAEGFVLSVRGDRVGLDSYRWNRNNPFRYRDLNGQLPFAVVFGAGVDVALGILGGETSPWALGKRALRGGLVGGASIFTGAIVAAESGIALLGAIATEAMALGTLDRGLGNLLGIGCPKDVISTQALKRDVAFGAAARILARLVQRLAELGAAEKLAAAQAKYPNKAGRIEQHHVDPKYLGGDPRGPRVPLDAAYHQEITNAFRDLWPYGGRKPTPAELEQIKRQVYDRFPLPDGD